MKHTRKSGARNIVGGQVRKARLQHKPPMSQDDLAGRLAVRGIQIDRSAVSRLENADRYVMDYEAEALAECLKKSARHKAVD
jgi:hypothetical protein